MTVRSGQLSHLRPPSRDVAYLLARPCAGPGHPVVYEPNSDVKRPCQTLSSRRRQRLSGCFNGTRISPLDNGGAAQVGSCHACIRQTNEARRHVTNRPQPPVPGGAALPPETPLHHTKTRFQACSIGWNSWPVPQMPRCTCCHSEFGAR